MVRLDSDFLTSENRKEGMKSITQEVFSILKEKKECTYHSICKSIPIATTETVRRRIYDILNVMRAVNLINKKNKVYYLVNNIYSLTKKKNEVKKLKEMKEAFEFITRRNKFLSNKEGERLYLPFMILSTEKNSDIHCETNKEKTFFNFTSDKPIAVFDDLCILKELKKESLQDSKFLFKSLEFDSFLF